MLATVAMTRVRVIYSRTTDVNAGEVTNRGRAARGCDYFLSLHFNAGKGNGAEVWCNCRETIGATEALLREALAPLIGWRKIASRTLPGGSSVVRNVAKAAPYRFNSTVNATDYYGVLRGCWSAGVSGDLLEIAFIDNADNIAAYQASKSKVWDAIAAAICKAFSVAAPSIPPVAPEQPKENQELYMVTIGPVSMGDKLAFEAQAKALEIQQVTAVPYKE